MPPNHKLHIVILYLILALALLNIGYGLLRQPNGGNGSTNNSIASDNRVLFWDIYPELVIPNTGQFIDKKKHLKTLHDKDISVQDLSKDGTLLIFRYSRYDCQLCIDQVLKKLQAIFEGDEKKVCLIVDGMSGREFRMKYKSMDIDFSAYFIVNDNLSLSLENKNFPFLFVLSREARVDRIFIPFKEYPKHTDAYLRNVKASLSD